MTDKEIIKALECCHEGVKTGCDKCPLHNKMNTDCIDRLTGSALNLINRQKEELDHFADVNKMVSEVRAEAIKEFAKFIIDKSKKGVTFNSDIPDYVQEMVGEE